MPVTIIVFKGASVSKIKNIYDILTQILHKGKINIQVNKKIFLVSRPDKNFSSHNNHEREPKTNQIFKNRLFESLF